MRFTDTFPLFGENLLPGSSWTIPQAYECSDDVCYGVPCGPRNGAWVLDLDKKDGKDGVHALMTYMFERDLRDLPETYTTQTKSGGTHLYFTYPEDREIRNRTGILEGVDVRGVGGFVRAGAGYPVVNDVECVPAPAWLIELVTTRNDAAPAISAFAIGPEHEDWEYRLDLAKEYLDEAPACVEGQGGDKQLWIVACHLTRTLELPIDKCMELVGPYNEKCCPPWEERLIARKMSEAALHGTGITGIPLRSLIAIPKLAQTVTPQVLAGPISAWRKRRGPHEYTFDMARDIAGTTKENPISQRDLAASLTGPGAHPDWVGVWQFDLFHNHVTAINPPLKLDAEDSGVSHADLANMRIWYSAQGTKTSTAMIEEAIRTAASAAACHFVRDYLRDLPPVTTSSLKSAGTAEFLFGSKSDEAAQVIDFLRRWMIGCIARVMTPGAQFDTVLTLLGPGGYHKSTFFKRLAVEPNWYRGNTPPITDPQKVGLAMRGHWIVELGELTTMRQAQRDMFLEFISRTEEKFRAPYERVEVTEKRQCGIGATSNNVEFLSTLDGAIQRRFLPIEVRKIIDTDWVSEHLDELWSEALAAYDEGEKWWVADERVLDGVKAVFSHQSPIEEKLTEFLEINSNRTTLNGKSASAIWETVFCDAQHPTLASAAQIQEIGTVMSHAIGVKKGRKADRRYYIVLPLTEDGSRALTDEEMAERAEADAVARQEAVGKRAQNFFAG